jgi:hypothetical protein
MISVYFLLDFVAFQKDRMIYDAGQFFLIVGNEDECLAWLLAEGFDDVLYQSAVIVVESM